MCGIAGCIGLSEPKGKSYLPGIVRRMGSRGPDDSGLWEAPNVMLGHRRLSIIDIGGSPQPMANNGATAIVTYNGELYNFRKLRAKLAAKSHVFRTDGDTEVLLHLYEEYGPEMTGEMDGMFAFALYDARKNHLLLARDRVGIKPLYYWHCPASGELVFASDLGALLEAGHIERRLDRLALAHYLSLGYVRAPHSWIENVRQLEPGHSLIWREGKIQVRRYYRWNYEPDRTLENHDRAVEALETALADSVTDHLIADVPVGSFLSAGLDSTTVTALAQRAMKASNSVRTFTVQFDDLQLDESARAAAIAEELDTEHVQIRGAELPFNRQVVEQIVDALGEPFGDTSALATFLLCGQAREHTKVALAGDGGDELFFGYSGMHRQRFARGLRGFPASLRKAGLGLPPDMTSDWLRRVRKYCELSLLDDTDLILAWSHRWGGKQTAVLGKDRLFESAETEQQLHAELRDEMGDGRDGGFLEQQFRFHLSVDLPSDCLFKVDRMSMAHGLEVRVPLLSNTMLDYSARLPLGNRIRHGRTKEPLRSLAERMSKVVAQPFPKHGFSFPVDLWMEQGFAEAWKDWRLTGTLVAIGFCAQGLQQMLNRYSSVKRGGYENSWLTLRLYDLMLLAVWIQKQKVFV